MGYYERNDDLFSNSERDFIIKELEKAREVDKFKRAITLNNFNMSNSERCQRIDLELMQRKRRGDYIPKIGRAINYETRGIKGTATVIGYDYIRGELRAVCAPANGQRDFGGPGIIITRLDEVAPAVCVSSNMVYR